MGLSIPQRVHGVEDERDEETSTDCNGICIEYRNSRKDVDGEG